MSAMTQATPSGAPVSTKAAVLVTAATSWEARPIARALGLSPSGRDRWEGAVGGRGVTLVRTGVGAVRTRALLEGSCAAKDYGLAISAGLCGAMQPDVKAGDIVADAHQEELGLAASLRETGAALKLPFHFGRILHTNVVLGPDAKRRLGAEHRAAACDMETAAVRRWAREASLPAIGVRAVLDALDDELPADPPDAEGAAAMAFYALKRPGQWGRMLKAGWGCRRSMRALGRFLKAYLEALP